MIPPQPRSTPFPYTTLFRSSMEAGEHAARDLGGPPPLADDGPPPSEKVDFENLPEFVKQRRMLKIVRVFGIFLALVVMIDRKSTRLNSSHRCISYAVFCLKK